MNDIESREDIYKHLNHKKYFFIMIYFGKKLGILVKSGGVLVGGVLVVGAFWPVTNDIQLILGYKKKKRILMLYESN